MIRSLVVFLALTGTALAQQPIRTGIDATFAPHAFPNLSGGYQGFNIDLANEIAKRLKRKIVIDAGQYSGLLPAMQAGTYDFVAAPTTVTKERAESMLFTEGYLNTDFQFLIKKGGSKIAKLEDLKGKIVSVNKGSAYESWGRDLEAKIGWKIESFGTQTDAVQAVLAGRADTNVAGNTAIGWAVTPSLPARMVDRAGNGLMDRLRLLGAVQREPVALVTPAETPSDSVPEALRRTARSKPPNDSWPSIASSTVSASRMRPAQVP